MPDFSAMLSKVRMSAVKPAYSLLQLAYFDYRADPAPCKAGVTNQCAVRMSIALCRCGFGMDAFSPQARVHRGRRACGPTMPHVLGAGELASYLRSLWGAPTLYRGATLADARAGVLGRKGVIYFNNCFSREDDGPRVGDHIDLWTGDRYYNDVIHVPAGGDAAAGTSLFGRADAVWFFDLPG